MGDRLRAGKPRQYWVFHQATQTNSASLTGREIKTSQKEVMHCGCGVKAGMAHSMCG